MAENEGIILALDGTGPGPARVIPAGLRPMEREGRCCSAGSGRGETRLASQRLARVWAAAVEDGGGGPDGAMGDRCPGSCETRVMAHGCLGRENQQQEKARAGQEVEAGDVNTQYEQVSQAAIGENRDEP